jgi:hypothetical protein
MLTGYLIGLNSTLPSKYFYIYILISCFFCGRGLFLSRVKHHLTLRIIGFVFVFFCSLLVGLFVGDSEARNFLFRAVSCIPTILVINFIYYRTGRYMLVDVLEGIYHGALINSILVVIFSLYPEYYDMLGISFFSGYDKGTRYLRSPGLQAGTDTAGYLATLGFICWYSVRQYQRGNVSRFGLGYLCLLIAPIFASRSAMIVEVIVLVLYSVSIGRKDGLLGKSVIWFLIAVYLYVSTMLVVSMYTNDVNMGWINEFIGAANIVDSYSFTSSDYESQYDIIDIIKIIPVGGSENYDNSVARLLASSGVLPLVTLIPGIIYMISEIRPSRVKAVIEWQVGMLFVIVYLLANLKNTYLFYPTFQVVLFSLVISLQGSSAIKFMLTNKRI